MNLKSIEIKNFKSLKDVKVGNLTKINLFYGYNNSGKSNILNFIEILFRGKTEETEEAYEENGEIITRRRVVAKTPFYEGYIYNMPFAFHNDEKENPIIYKVELTAKKAELDKIEDLIASGFTTDLENYEVEFSGEVQSVGSDDLKFVLNSAKLNGKVIAELEGRSLQYPEASNDVAEALLASFNNSVLFLDSDRYFQPEFSELDLMDVSSKNFKHWMFELFMNHKTKKEFTENVTFINSFKLDLKKFGGNLKENSNSLPFGKTDIGFTRFGSELELMLKNGAISLPLKNFGTGIQQILYILSRVYHTKAKIVIVEELELNLSPLFQFELVRFFKNRIGQELDQLLFTSHSPNFNHEPDLVDNHCYRISIDNTRTTSVQERNITVDNIPIANIYE